MCAPNNIILLSREKKKLDADQQAALDRMIGYANDILSSGDMDIYQRTFEQLKYALAPKNVSSRHTEVSHDVNTIQERRIELP